MLLSRLGTAISLSSTGHAIIILELGGGPLDDALRLDVAVVGAVEDEDRVA